MRRTHWTGWEQLCTFLEAIGQYRGNYVHAQNPLDKPGVKCAHAHSAQPGQP